MKWFTHKVKNSGMRADSFHRKVLECVKSSPSLSFSSWRKGTGHTPESTGGDLRFLVPPTPHRKAIKEGQRVVSFAVVLQTQKPSAKLLILSPQSYLPKQTQF